MIKINRKKYDSHPDVQRLINAAPRWDGEGKFNWRIEIEGRGFHLRKKLLPVLLEMTKKHCAFCDYYPLSEELINPIPIEHFFPKSKNKFPEKAYEWRNLFPSCNGCTSKKKDRFDEQLLKPDEEDYSFDTFFEVSGDGKLMPSKIADSKSKERAKVTIEIYGLNKRGILLSERKKHLRDYLRIAPIDDIDNRPYRFLIENIKEPFNPDDVINRFFQ
ncbi:MAG: hypothetical protein NXI25_15660 [bacterium]|nr:hypothetical protein [bacterium]